MTLDVQSCASIARLQRVLLGHPGAFAVAEVHNPHMEQSAGVMQQVDQARALQQWQALRDSYESIGVATAALDPVEGLADLCFTANPSFVLPLPDGSREVWLARMRHASRAPEVEQHRRFFAEAQETLRTMPEHVPHFEGCGDGLLHPGRFLLHAGVGPRSSPEAWDVLQQAHPELRVLRYSLVDPRFYHLDTAISVLDPVIGAAQGGPDAANIAYLPGAFDEASQRILAERFPDAIRVSDADGAVFGLNSASDGYNVFISPRATGFEAQLRERGYNPVLIDLSELLLGGGGIKCCTLELRAKRDES